MTPELEKEFNIFLNDEIFLCMTDGTEQDIKERSFVFGRPLTDDEIQLLLKGELFKVPNHLKWCSS